MTYDKTSVAGKAIQAIHKKQKPKGELYDTQGIEGLRRVSDKKQSAEKWFQHQIDMADTHALMLKNSFTARAMARTLEREKFIDAGQIRTLIKERDAMRDERIKQETAKKIFEEIEDIFGKNMEKTDLSGGEGIEQKLFKELKAKWIK